MDSTTMASAGQMLTNNASSASLSPHYDQSMAMTTFTPHTSQYSFVSDDENNSTIYNQSTWAMSISSTAIVSFFANSNDTANTRPERHLHWTNFVLALGLCVLIVITVIGNTLVILSVLTTRRLRTVTNCFVMSLAVADWLVGIFVMPPAVAIYLIGSWQLGWIFCNIWISLDVLLCTASILSLCAISIDRYLAVTQPLNYSRRRRSKRLALLMILIVWVLALAITCPPILGWYDHTRKNRIGECGYNQNEGYVVFSAMGSFFIPMAVMVYVYMRISCVVARRHDHMAEIEVHKRHNKHFDVEIGPEVEAEPSSELDPQSPYRKRPPSLQSDMKSSVSIDLTETNSFGNKSMKNQPQQQQQSSRNGHYELVNASNKQMSVSQKRCGGSGSGCGGSRGKANNPSTSEHWSKCMHQCSMKQPSSVVVYEHCVTSKQHGRSTTHHKSLSNRILSLKRENKTTQTLSIVVFSFLLCWFPFFITYLITPFLPPKAISGTLTTLLTWLGWFNSAMNPFIYAFYSVDFRNAFWRLTFRRFFKNSSKAPYSSNAMSIKR